MLTPQVVFTMSISTLQNSTASPRTTSPAAASINISTSSLKAIQPSVKSTLQSIISATVHTTTAEHPAFVPLISAAQPPASNMGVNTVTHSPGAAHLRRSVSPRSQSPSNSGHQQLHSSASSAAAGPGQPPSSTSSIGGGGGGAGGPGGRCCETGRPIYTDPATGQTICSCQHEQMLQYQRLAQASLMGHHASGGGAGGAGPGGMHQLSMYGAAYGPDGGPAGMPPGGGAYLPGSEQAHFYQNVVSFCRPNWRSSVAILIQLRKYYNMLPILTR